MNGYNGPHLGVFVAVQQKCNTISIDSFFSAPSMANCHNQELNDRYPDKSKRLSPQCIPTGAMSSTCPRDLQYSDQHSQSLPDQHSLMSPLSPTRIQTIAFVLVDFRMLRQCLFGPSTHALRRRLYGDLRLSILLHIDTIVLPTYACFGFLVRPSILLLHT